MQTRNKYIHLIACQYIWEYLFIRFVSTKNFCPSHTMVTLRPATQNFEKYHPPPEFCPVTPSLLSARIIVPAVNRSHWVARQRAKKSVKPLPFTIRGRRACQAVTRYQVCRPFCTRWESKSWHCKFASCRPRNSLENRFKFTGTRNRYWFHFLRNWLECHLKIDSLATIGALNSTPFSSSHWAVRFEPFAWTQETRYYW